MRDGALCDEKGSQTHTWMDVRVVPHVSLPHEDIVFILHEAVLQATDPTQTSTDDCPAATR